MIANPVATLGFVTVALAMCLAVEGIVELALATQPAPDPGTGWLYVDGILTLLLSGLLWRTWPWPAAATWKLGVLVGSACC